MQLPNVSELEKNVSLISGQENCPPEIITKALNSLNIQSYQTLIDWGCGDGRVLIEACQRFNCNGIGIEIDPRLANLANQKIKSVGLENKIKIVVGDVRDFSPPSTPTVSYAYLYYELLEEILPKLKKSSSFVTPYHRVASAQTEVFESVFLWRDY